MTDTTDALGGFRNTSWSGPDKIGPLGEGRGRVWPSLNDEILGVKTIGLSIIKKALQIEVSQIDHINRLRNSEFTTFVIEHPQKPPSDSIYGNGSSEAKTDREYINGVGGDVPK